MWVGVFRLTWVYLTVGVWIRLRFVMLVECCSAVKTGWTSPCKPQAKLSHRTRSDHRWLGQQVITTDTTNPRPLLFLLPSDLLSADYVEIHYEEGKPVLSKVTSPVRTLTLFGFLFSFTFFFFLLRAEPNWFPVEDTGPTAGKEWIGFVLWGGWLGPIKVQVDS